MTAKDKGPTISTEVPDGILFNNHPDPMWIYEIDSLLVLQVNDAAIHKYGYSREDFLRMTIADLRPVEERSALLETVAKLAAGINEAGVWRHRLRSGDIISVEVNSHDIVFQGKSARLVTTRDMRRVIELETANATLLEREREAQGLSRRLLETVENISDAFLTLDGDWRLTFMNRHAEQLLLRKRHSLLGKVIWAEFPEAVGSTFQIEYIRAVSTGQTARFTEYFPPLSRWFEVNAYPTADGLAIYFRDVTLQRANQSHLRLLETAVSRLNDILLITDAEPLNSSKGPRIVFANDAFVRLTGYSRSEIIGKTPRILQGPKTQKSELQRIRRAMEKWQPIRSEIINYTKSGNEYWVELDIVPIQNDAGCYTHWVAVERDITDRKLAEEVIKESEERFRLVTKATNDVVWDWSLTNDRVWWNDNMRSQFGHEATSTDGNVRVWIDHIHPDDRERVLDRTKTAVEGRESHWIDEYRFLRADGSAATVVDRGFIIRNDAGEAIRMLGSMLDVTERRELDEQLRQAQKLEALGQLTGGVAHDFNNLLTVVLGNAELLCDRLADRQQLRTIAEMITTAAERGAELTNRLLAFARKQSLQPKLVDINTLVRGMEGLLRRTLAEDITIAILLHDGLWTVEIDPGQLEVALLNLALNARDAMPQGGGLTIKTSNELQSSFPSNSRSGSQGGEYAVISVSDTGTGMSTETLQRAFEPFFTTKEPGKGSGLGLSMVYGFVQQSGGHAQICSVAGEGTTINFYFPRAARIGGILDAYTDERSTIGGREHILVVEDDELVRHHVISQLSGLGYRVSSATDGCQALEILSQAENIDLLFTDIIMPGGLNGQQLAEKAKDLRPGLHLLFTSGYSQSAIIHDGRLDKSIRLLKKPYRREELASTIRVALSESNG